MQSELGNMVTVVECSCLDSVLIGSSVFFHFGSEAFFEETEHHLEWEENWDADWKEEGHIDGIPEGNGIIC